MLLNERLLLTTLSLSLSLLKGTNLIEKRGWRIIPLSLLSTTCSAYPSCPTATTTTITAAGRLSVWSNPGRAPGYLSGKYLQATVQKPNLVCGRLILSYYIPSVDSSGLGPLSPSLSTLFRAHFLHPSPPSAASLSLPPCPLVPTIPVNCPKLFDCPRKHVFRETPAGERKNFSLKTSPI